MARSDFSMFKIAPELQERLAKNGIKNPMPVQEQAIPALLAGRDVIARAQTGTGKTLAFVIPLLTKIERTRKFVQALVVTPTRELAQQITGEIRKLDPAGELGVLTVSGGRDFEEQKKKLAGRTQILVGTPGRLLDHLRKGNTSLGGVHYFVLDEVDEMLRQGFGDEVAQLVALIPEQHQTMFCSATLNEEVKKLGAKLTRNCRFVDIDPAKATVDKIKQICIKVSEEKKLATLEALIARLNPYLMLVFCISKERVVELEAALAAKDYEVAALHGDMSQAKRRTVMKSFRSAKLQILVASDIAARGLDVEGVTHVINYDIPHDVDWYVHRIGRTGRAGADGTAITLYSENDGVWLKNIESKLKVTMERQTVEGKTVTRTKRPVVARPAAKTRPSAKPAHPAGKAKARSRKK